MPYATAAEVKDKDLSRQIAQATWVDADLEDRIAEGDAVIDACMRGLGYAVPFSPVPPLIKRLSILYGRYAAMRDLHHHFAPSQAGGAGFNGYREQFERLLEKLQKGQAILVDASGTPLPTVESTAMRVQTNTEDLRRALNMGDPESATLDTADYTDPGRLGDPS